MRIFRQAVASALCSVALAVGSVLPAQASLSQPAVVSDNPADTTPHIVLDDTSNSVYAYEQVGRTMYAGGRFSQVQDPTRTTTYSRANFVAFDSETGVVSPLDLSFDGMVTAIEATADGTALFIAGAFAKVNGITRRGILKYDLVSNRVDPTFAPTGMRTVSDLELANGAVIAAGNFTKKLMALDPTTGADTGAIDITVAGTVDPDDETRIKNLAVSPDGTRLVATGNFATVDDQNRKRAFMLNLGPTATLSTWYAPRFDVDCAALYRLSAQGVDFSPDGSYFVIVATGGPTGTNGVCDAAARFETADVSSTVEPSWINWTGGDTLYSVAVTGAAVYVGGHQRWLDNPYGFDSAGPGAVERPGIGAIDPVTGKALGWNPTKSREHGTMVLFATSRGLWVGSDGARFGREDHAGIGFAPLDSGPTPDTTPNTFIDSGPSDSVTDTSATFSFSATEPSTFMCRLDGAAFAPCTSPVSYVDLTAGSHTFQVAATDGSYNVDASPAERSWTVLVAPSDPIAPTVTEPPPAAAPTPTPLPALAPTSTPPDAVAPALTSTPTLASVGLFADRAGDMRTGADLRRLLVRNEGVITIQSTHRNLTRRLGAVVTMYIDTRTSKIGPEYLISAGLGPSTGWVVRKVRGWKAVGDPVSCTSTMRVSYATERVTFAVARACVGRPGRIRIAALVTDGRLKDWGPSKRTFNTWVARG